MKKKLIVPVTFLLSLISANNASATERYCREFTKDVYINGQQEVAYGTACLQENGDWKIISENEPANKTKVIKYSDNYHGLSHNQKVVIINNQPRPWKSTFYKGNNHKHYHYNKRYKKYNNNNLHLFWNF